MATVVKTPSMHVTPWSLINIIRNKRKQPKFNSVIIYINISAILHAYIYSITTNLVLIRMDFIDYKDSLWVHFYTPCHLITWFCRYAPCLTWPLFLLFCFCFTSLMLGHSYVTNPSDNCRKWVVDSLAAICRDTDPVFQIQEWIIIGASSWG